jgi:chemotaxis protein MotB
MKLKKRGSHSTHEEVDTEGSWAISYGDMITLLLSFFVIYFSTDFKKPQEEMMRNEMLAQIETIGDVDQDKEVIQNKSLPHDDIGEKPEWLSVGVDVAAKPLDAQNIMIYFKGTSFFDSGDTKLNEQAKTLLNEFAKKVIPFAGKFKIKIQAFTDPRPVRNSSGRSYSDNLELSALRAVNVMKELNQDGIPLSRLEITGRGVMTEKLRKFMNIDENDKKTLNAMSRTVAFIMKREE